MSITTPTNYWKFDESSGNAVDAVGSSNLTNSNIAYVAAKINNGAQFNGSSSRFNASANLLGANDGFSMSFIFKSTTKSANGAIISQYTSVVAGVWWVNTSTGGCLQLQQYNGSSVFTAVDVVDICDGNPHIVTFYINSAHTSFRVQVDGGSYNTYAITGVTNWATHTTYFGWKNNDFFTATYFDAMGFWKNYELTSGERGELYNSGNGTQYPFVPPVDPPTVTTQAVDNIGVYDARGNGNITDIGVGSPDLRGFVWGTSSHGDPGNVAPASSDYGDYVSASGSFSTGAFTGAIDSLAPETTYYVRAWAHNADGYAYGGEVSFATLAIPYAISGVVSLSGAPVENAVVRCIRQSDNTALADVLTDASGIYIFEELDVAELYHLSVEYFDDPQRYNALSYWDITPYEVV